MFDLVSKVLKNAKNVVIDYAVGENEHKDLGDAGRIITLIEQNATGAKLLKSLGENRNKLFKIIFDEKSNDDIITRLKVLPTELPIDDPISKFATGFIVHGLYGSMLHPPQTYLGNKFQYRSADGSNNNILFPQLGKAGMPYAKSIPSIRAVHASQPDPGDLFDLLLARDETQDDDVRESNLGLSSMLLYHATVIIHDVFRTNEADKNISDTSSYLDLSPLYGKDAESQSTIRAFSKGLLKPDSFAEQRLSNQPVGVCIYLVMYNRFHNYVAQQILQINERGKFFEPPVEKPKNWKPNANWQPPKHWAPADQPELKSADHWIAYRKKLTEDAKKDVTIEQKIWNLWRDAAMEKLDEDLFQTARLITCGMYINVSVHDYLRVLMRVHLKNTAWTLDPRKEIPVAGIDPRGVQRGQGNQVSAEFNALYRFHSPLSRRDVKWTSNFLQELLQDFVKKDGTPAGAGPSMSRNEMETLDIPIPVMRAALMKMYSKLPSLQEKLKAKAIPEGLGPKFTAGKIDYEFKRHPETHKFDDDELVKEMVKVMEDPICEYGAKNTARLFRSIEILGILQARKWELASLNEFRRFFGLSEHKTFEDINSSPEISSKLRDLYRDPDQVELYPGLLCEGEGRCLDPGTSGPNGDTALWRGVFSDAVTLVRSDRFYTTDWNVGSLTGWGMREVTSDPDVMKGSVLHRLFQRAFPGFFSHNSLHLCQPFHLPAMNYLLGQGQDKMAGLESLKALGLNENQISQIYQFIGGVAEVGLPPPPKPDESRPPLNEKDIVAKVFGHLAQNTAKLEDLELKNPKKGPQLGYTRADAEQIKDILHKPEEQARRRKVKLESIADAKESNDKDKESKDKAKESASRQADLTIATAFAGLQLNLKPLKRVIKMPENRFDRLKTTAIKVTSYSTIVDKVLKEIDKYKNPGFLESPPKKTGPLRPMLTGNFADDPQLKSKVESARSTLRDMVSQDKKQQLFANYFNERARYYIHERGRNYQKFEVQFGKTEKKSMPVWQIDIVSDYVIPIVADFITDFLGFWNWTDQLKPTEVATHAKTVYDHLNNCQDYLTYDSDETTVLARRNAFELSIAWLYDGAVWGAKNVTKPGSKDAQSLLRTFGIDMAKELSKQDLKPEEVAAIRLSIALEAVHKSVLMFTEVLNYLLHEQKNGKSYLWQEIQDLVLGATNDVDRRLAGYVLEAQRLAVHVPLIRQIPLENGNPGSILTEDENQKDTALKAGDMLLLDIHKAQQNSNKFPKPTEFVATRPSDIYIIYGRKKGDPFTAKHITLIAITALIKQVAGLAQLRRAHDTEGRLNTVETPDGVRRYLTQEFDQLVPFPTTWQLRFDCGGRGVWNQGDNSEVEHGIDQIYQDGALSARGGTFVSE